MDEERRRVVLGAGFVAFGLVAVAQAVFTNGARTWSVGWWATIVGGSVSAGAGAFAARRRGWVGDDGDDHTLTFWTAVAGILLYLAGSAVVLL